MNELKSYTEYAVSTPTADFVIGFDFNYGEDAVNVTVDDVSASEAGYTVVYLNETTIRLSPSVPSGVVRLQRETDIDQTDHAYRAGAKFIAQTMDENFKQIRHSQQEVNDNFSSLEGRTSARLDTFSDQVDNLNNEFISTRDVVSDLVTISADTVNTANNALNTANAIDAKASTALSNSSTALSTATGIDAKATDALDNSLTAVLNSSAALNTANAVDGKATQALTDSATAVSSATTAVNTANAVDAKATQALADAAAALTAASGTLKSSNNLSDVSSAAVSRANLGVMSSSEVTTAIANATLTLPDATETTAGKAKIATTAIAQAGTNDTDIITAKKLRDVAGNAIKPRSWSDVTASRIAETWYSNTTGNDIGVYVSKAGANSNVYIAVRKTGTSTELVLSGTGVGNNLVALTTGFWEVPDGFDYLISPFGTVMELRV